MPEQLIRRRNSVFTLDARRTVLLGLCVALVGVAVGFVLTGWLGTASPAESGLIAACLVVVTLFIALLLKPSPWPAQKVSALASAFFSAYLPVVALSATWASSEFYRVLPYLIWYYPLLVFNKFNNSGRTGALLDKIIAAGPILLLLLYVTLHSEVLDADLLGILWAAGTAHVAYAIFLDRFTGYREALADQYARAEESVKTANSLRENERRFQEALHQAGLGLGMIDAEGRLAWANQTVIVWAGRGDIVSIPFTEILSEENRQPWKDQVGLLQNGQITRMLFECKVAGPGGDRVIESTFFLAPSVASLPNGIIFICRDITDVRELDAQLRQSQKMDALGRLTGGIAHDFNNLLTVMLGSAEALQDRLSQGSEERELAEVIEEAGERASGLIRHLLSFSQKQALSPRSCSPSRLVEEASHLLTHGLPETVDLHLELKDAGWQIRVDPGQFEAALLNLVVNARDAMPDGGRISIRVEASAGAGMEAGILLGEHVAVTVADTGVGIPADQVGRVLEPFFTTKAPDKGTGLGLSIVYGFVKQSGGDISICSQLGKGTEITLAFPRFGERP